MRLVRTLLVASLVALVLALAATPAGAQSTPTLVDVRAGRHPGFDRVVFEFQGAVPEHHVRYVDQLVEDGSGVLEMECDILIPAALEGSEISVHYDPLLAKLIAAAEMREAAIGKPLALELTHPFGIDLREVAVETFGKDNIFGLDSDKLDVWRGGVQIE